MTMPISGRLLCPKCQEILVPVDRDGVEVDYCPHCRGVWLDRGELDKILARAGGREIRVPSNPQYPPYEYDDDYYEGKPRRKRKRLKSFLEDLFDFD